MVFHTYARELLKQKADSDLAGTCRGILEGCQPLSFLPTVVMIALVLVVFPTV